MPPAIFPPSSRPENRRAAADGLFRPTTFPDRRSRLLVLLCLRANLRFAHQRAADDGIGRVDQVVGEQRWPSGPCWGHHQLKYIGFYMVCSWQLSRDPDGVVRSRPIDGCTSWQVVRDHPAVVVRHSRQPECCRSWFHQVFRPHLGHDLGDRHLDGAHRHLHYKKTFLPGRWGMARPGVRPVIIAFVLSMTPPFGKKAEVR